MQQFYIQNPIYLSIPNIHLASALSPKEIIRNSRLLCYELEGRQSTVYFAPNVGMVKSSDTELENDKPWWSFEEELTSYYIP